MDKEKNCLNFFHANHLKITTNSLSSMSHDETAAMQRQLRAERKIKSLIEQSTLKS